MGFWARLKAAFSPAKLTGSAPIINAKPLHEQFQRIGGGLTPADVSHILRIADSGQPERLIDLTNESRQRDGHMQSVCGTREQAVALTDFDFVEPPDATAKEKEAVDLCRQIRDDFKNWQTLLEHLAGSFLPGHATAELLPWQKTKQGFLVPNEAAPIHARDFIFSRDKGALRYRRSIGDTIGVDLLAENPGRIVQVQRRIVGDVPAREGLMRVLVWAALFRNWSLRDWIALGEVGWKPYRIGKFHEGQSQEEIDKLTRALELLGQQGLAVIHEADELNIEWPKGAALGGTGSVHRELFDTIGREMSKATIGSATTLEAAPNGDRASTETRDKVRGDIKEADCRAIAVGLRQCLFAPAVAFNLGGDVRVPFGRFLTEEAADQKEFSEAVKNYVEAGVRVPAKWVRDEAGMPEPQEGEEVLEKAQVPAALGGDSEDDDLDIPIDVDEDDEDATKTVAKPKQPKPGQGVIDGQGFVDALVDHATKRGEEALRPDLEAILRAVEAAKDYDDLRERLRVLYEGFDPDELTELTTRVYLVAEMAGRAAVNQDATA